MAEGGTAAGQLLSQRNPKQPEGEGGRQIVVWSLVLLLLLLLLLSRCVG